MKKLTIGQFADRARADLDELGMAVRKNVWSLRPEFPYLGRSREITLDDHRLLTTMAEQVARLERLALSGSETAAALAEAQEIADRWPRITTWPGVPVGPRRITIVESSRRR